MKSLSCTQCGAQMPDASVRLEGWQTCPICGAELQVMAFPALWAPPAEGQSGETLDAEGQASCFFHPKKKAVIPCDSCGRFLCALCDLELHGRHLCPQCLETGAQKGKVQNLENRRIRYDCIALSMALLPFMFWPLTLLTAPATLFLGVRYWNAPVSLVPRFARLRLVTAMLLAAAECTGWALGLTYLISKWRG